MEEIQETTPVERVGAEGEGWQFFINENEDSNVSHFNIDPEKFEPPVKEEGEGIWITRKSDGIRFLAREGNFLEVVQVVEEGPKIKESTGKSYTFLKSLINDDMFMLHGSDMYQVDLEKSVMCTGDDTCTHCKECSTCASLNYHNKDKGEIVDEKRDETVE